jgi:hypothetical protein
MDTRKLDAAEAFGKFLGSLFICAVIVAAFSLILLASWNHCVPQVFGGSEITLQQSLSLLGVAWSLCAITRMRL